MAQARRLGDRYAERESSKYDSSCTYVARKRFRVRLLDKSTKMDVKKKRRGMD